MAFVSPYSISRAIAMETDRITSNLWNAMKQPSTLATTGYTSSAVTAKYVSLKHGIPSVAFESPQISTASIGSMIVDAKLRPNDFSALTSNHMAKIYNYFSQSFTTSFVEDKTFVNIRLPQVDSSFEANVFETFCLLGAACATSNVWDHFCNYTIGADKYTSYFERWNRTRTAML